jgi:hypothetical protein
MKLDERIDGERIRLAHAIDQHYEHVRNIARCPANEIPSPDVGQALVMSSLGIATILARLSAYLYAGADTDDA